MTRMRGDLRSGFGRRRVGATAFPRSIYEKTGARTRGELSAMLFFGEHLPRIQDRVPVGDNALFIDAPRPRG
jgi:hypothetical protein